MHGIEVMLPGGLLKDGCVERRARFRDLTGNLERALIELEMGSDRPGYVTAVLSSTLDRIGNQSVNAEYVDDLCVADRQYLMLRLAAILDSEQMWLKVGCGYCDALFDVDIRRCDLPVKEAGQGFPQVVLRVKDWIIDARVPTGADQAHIRELSEADAMQQLLQSCVLSVNGKLPDKEFFEHLSDADIDTIDAALEDASPSICNQLLVTCPECGQEQRAELDHYALAGMNERFFYDEIHTLASHYHWSEAAILELPQVRRRLYLDMINRSAVMSERGRST